MLTQLAALIPTRGQSDLSAWQAWKAAPTDANLTALLNQVNPLIQSQVSKWAGTLARPLLEAEGKRLAVLAFQSYDPNRGVALGTHVVNYLMKLSRLSYSNQNVARLPENKVLKFHTYRTGQAMLVDQLGREPTVDELSDHLGWSIPHLTAFKKDIAHQEILESGGLSDATPKDLSSGTEDSDSFIDFAHHDLPPAQKVIFEHLTGYGGAKILTNAEIMKKLKITQGVYSYQKRLMVEGLEELNRGR